MMDMTYDAKTAIQGGFEDGTIHEISQASKHGKKTRVGRPDPPPQK